MTQAIVRSSFFGLSTVTWKRSIWHTGVRVIGIDSRTSGFPIRCLAARRSRTSRSSKASLKPKMADESDAFYVVRKGDMVGIYKRLSDCQAQVSSSVCDPSVSVYKGYCLRKETEDYLASQGFKDALYTMHASHLKDDMFGSIVACPFQQPDGLAFLVDKTPKGPSTQKRSQEVGNAGSCDMPISLSNKLFNLAPNTEAQHGNKLMTCIVEFDGASKGNPGKAGAGAVLRTEDGNVISHVREGLGIATNNVAEYRALILGMKYALMRGFKHIRVQGDSQLVCLQFHFAWFLTDLSSDNIDAIIEKIIYKEKLVQELWQTKNQNMADLCKEVKKLRDMFQSFSITHVRREFNAIADNLANLAVSLPVGEICEDFGPVS